MKLWLDDERPMPPQYDVHVRTAQNCIELLKTGKITEVSLDHDLGLEDETGYTVACFLEETAVSYPWMPYIKWNVHSANPVGREKMTRALESYDRLMSLGNTQEQSN